MTKTFTVVLDRTIRETTTVTVQAPDKKTASFLAAAQEQTWAPVETKVRVGEIAEVE